MSTTIPPQSSVGALALSHAHARAYTNTNTPTYTNTPTSTPTHAAHVVMLPSAVLHAHGGTASRNAAAGVVVVLVQPRQLLGRHQR